MSLHHKKFLRNLLASSPGPPTEFDDDAKAVSLNHGLAYVQLVLGVAGSGAASPPVRDRVVDTHGRSRPLYRPLLAHALLQTSRLSQHATPAAWCAAMDQDVRHLTDRRTSGGDSESCCRVLWCALGCGDAELTAERFDAVLARPGAEGRLLKPSPDEHPELIWYYELAALHALLLHRVIADRRELDDVIDRAVTFHLQETQPDHATMQPWALAAFARHDDARPLFEWMIHSIQMQQASTGEAGGDAVTSILLADALYCLA